MNADLAVIHERLLALVNELDRVLDGEDVILPLEIREIHHRRECRGFSGTRRTGHEDHAFLQHREPLDHRWQPQFVGGENFVRNEPEDRADAVLLVEKICAEAREAGILVAEVHVARFLELLDLVFRRDLIDERLEIIAGKVRRFDADHFAVNAEDRRIAGGEMQVGGILLFHEFEVLINAGHAA